MIDEEVPSRWVYIEIAQERDLAGALTNLHTTDERAIRLKGSEIATFDIVHYVDKVVGHQDILDISEDSVIVVVIESDNEHGIEQGREGESVILDDGVAVDAHRT